MVCFVVLVSVILGLLCLIDEAASSALFSLAVAGNDLAWMVPILSRLVWGKERFHPGEFYTGWFSKPIAVTAVVYLAYVIVLSMFPTGGPGPSRKFILSIPSPRLGWVVGLGRLKANDGWCGCIAQDMNYTIVINGSLWLGAMVYYVVYARKVYRGPQMTVGAGGESSGDEK